MEIAYYLQPNPVAADPNSHSARVLPHTIFDTDGIIKKMTQRGTGCTEADIRAVLHIYYEVVSDEVSYGNHVNTPLANYKPGIVGVFASAADSFDSSRHEIKANISSGVLMAQKMKVSTVTKIRKPEPKPFILEYIDVNSGLSNSKVTSGGMGLITGEELKFNPENVEEGIFFVNGTTTKVAVIGTRTEGKLMFTVPTLPAGNYSLEVRKAYQTTSAIRSGALPKVLVVS